MNMILCLDNRGGMSFFGRRQSMDRVLRKKALDLAGNELWMDTYSAGQFQEESPWIRVTGDPLTEVPEEGWYFLELGDPDALLPHVDKLAVFRWNRDYPSDRRFSTDDFLCPILREDFPGNSHETITLEVYQL